MELKKQSLLNLIIYLVLYLLGGTLVIALITSIVSNINNISYDDLFNQISSTTYTDLNLFKLANFTANLSNFITYLLMFISLIIVNFKYLKENFFKIKNKYISFIIYSIVGFIVIYGLTYVINYLYDLYNIGVSDNQDTIVNYIKYGNALISFFAVVICAPLVEELIYRYSIFSLFNNRIISYIVSILFFMLPHMLSTTSDMLTWFLLAIPYLISGFMLAYIYDSSKNIYASIIAHMLNNLMSFIVIVL